jgi:GGDEF domain-containing protein
MPPIPLPADEAGRIASLRDLALLDTPPDLDFDVFPALAARFFATPIAAVSLVDSDRVWFKASHGLDAKEVSRGVSPCAHAILQPDALMIVPDAQEDLRFHDNPLVTGAPGIRFYASAPILGPGGHAVGALCIVDRVRREITDDALLYLRYLARRAAAAMRRHRTAARLGADSQTDALTGACTPFGFETTLQRRINDRRLRHQGESGLSALVGVHLRRRAGGRPLCAEPGGTSLLSEVVRRLRSVLRQTDIIARTGEEEFVIHADGLKDQASVAALAARLQRALAGPLLHRGGELAVSAAVSVTEVEMAGQEVSHLLEAAETAVQAARCVPAH